MRFEKLKVDELKVFCKENNINITGKNKKQILFSIYENEKENIINSIKLGNDFDYLKEKINRLADEYADILESKIILRKKEMKDDDNSHYLIYRVLGISLSEGELIDQYQNTGRFLYKYAGSFLEEAATICLSFANTFGGKSLIENKLGMRPKTFEIDFLNRNDAIELKWRDATTDGDHITKEHTRVKAISASGYKPVRVMFYYPQRDSAIKIQEALKTLYKGVGGEYYAGDDAWDYIKNISGYDLKNILTDIAIKRESK